MDKKLNQQQQIEKQQQKWYKEKNGKLPKIQISAKTKNIYQSTFEFQNQYKSFDIENIDLTNQKIIQKKVNQQQTIKFTIPTIFFNYSGLIALKNMGNTCYMNSVLQCLLHIPDFNQSCMEHPSNGKIHKAYIELIKYMRNRDISEIKPYNFKKSFDEQNELFIQKKQYDSHEFFIALLNLLSKDLSINTPTKFEYKQLTADIKKQSLNQISNKWWKASKELDNSIIKDYFTGQLLTQVTCALCNYVFINFDNFCDLTLSLQDYYHVNLLEDMLKNYVRSQKMTTYICRNCEITSQSIVQKKVTIFRWPKILTFQINRFKRNSDFIIQKNKKKIVYPYILSLNKMKEFDASNQQWISDYKLIGVINHEGQLDYGHYTAQCFNQVNKKWLQLNDSKIRQSDKNNKKIYQSQYSYLLFYCAI